MTCLSFYDENESIQLLVNLVFLGKTKIVNQYQYYNYTKEEINKMKKDNNKFKKNIDKNEIESINDNTIPSLVEEYFYYSPNIGNGNEIYNTLISSDGKELISGNPEQVVPIFLINMKMDTTTEHAKLYFLNNKSNLMVRNNFLKDIKFQDCKKIKELELIEKDIINLIKKTIIKCLDNKKITEFNKNCNFLETDLFDKFKREINSMIEDNKENYDINNLDLMNTNKKFIEYFKKIELNRQENLHKSKKAIIYFKEKEMQKMIKISLGKDYYLIKHPNYKKYSEEKNRATEFNSYVVYSGDLFFRKENIKSLRYLYNFCKGLKSKFSGAYYGTSKSESLDFFDGLNSKIINQIEPKI